MTPDVHIPSASDKKANTLPSPRAMVDQFGRHITYVRLSLTDRCDLRCRYCMGERMTFLPRSEVLTLEELLALADVFIARGARRIRLTGGEPLVRRDAIDLIRAIGRRIGHGLDELTLTTNGTQLERFAGPLRDAGIRRINVSLDSRDADRFRHITRRGNLDQVLGGIAAAKAAGLQIRINMVALGGINDDEIGDMLGWCVEQGHDLALIESMPLGEPGADRVAERIELADVQHDLEQSFVLSPSAHRTGGPARYFDVAGSTTRLGLISPMSHNFCDGCNRIRVSATGTVYGCLGHEQKVELRDILRSGGATALQEALDQLLAGKPRRHDFDLERPHIARHMNLTGG